MAFSFKSIGHFFATVFTAVEKELPKVAATEGVVEAVTAAIPVYGPLALTVEKAAYAALGELSAVINAGDAAAKAKLSDAGLDVNVIATVEALVKSIPALAAVAKTVKPTA